MQLELDHTFDKTV